MHFQRHAHHRHNEFQVLATSSTNQNGASEWFSLLVAGGVSGAVTKSATAPLERTKILLQVQVKQCIRTTRYYLISVSPYSLPSLLGYEQSNISKP